MMRGLVQAAVGFVAAAALMSSNAEAQVLTPPMNDAEITDDQIRVDFGQDALVGVEEFSDPFEPFNRRMFAIHNFLDGIIFVPAARTYRYVTPRPARRGVRRFLANARSPVVFGNDLFQGEFKRAGTTLGRFVFNTIWGLGGFLDPAARMGIEGHNEDFGQTLAVWGAPSGPYIFLPLFGPTSIRDGIGFGVDFGLHPLNYFNEAPFGAIRGGRLGATALSARERALDPLEQIKANSLDYYASFRSFYAQARAREIANGQLDFNELPDIGDFEEFEDFDDFEEFDDLE